MPRVICPSCKNKMTAINSPSKQKHIVIGKETLSSNIAVCTHCGSRAKYTCHTILIKDAVQLDLLTA